MVKAMKDYSRLQMEILTAYLFDKGLFSEMCRQMRVKGGGFIKKLEELIGYADDTNVAKIVMTWADDLEFYFNLAKGEDVGHQD